ncbi:MAG: alpha-L-fucosidase, partial [Verrucomicrobia bacterium]|nr:alpha-L-fucosidase [Verrucomicrobiota bacterium]
MKFQYQPPIGRRWVWTAIIGLTPFLSLLANHWCMTACERVSAMVPRWNRALECARKLEFPIIWCPSDVVGSYAGWPQRERALALTPLEVPKKNSLACSFTASVGRCMCGPGLNCVVNYGEYGINPDLVIADADYITSSTPEVYTILRRHGITHVIYLGLHTNMCLFGKPGALRDMENAGLICWLARDINDAFTHYDPAAGFTPDRGTRQTDEDLERAGIPTLNLVEEWRKAGLWNGDWIVETVRIAPWGKPGRPYLFEQGVDVTLTTPWLENVEIHYTLERCEDVGRPPDLTTGGPTAQSPLYDKPVHVTETSMLRAVAIRDGRPVSLPTSAWFVRLPHAVPKPDIFVEDLTPLLDPYANVGGQAWFWIPKVGKSFGGKELGIRGTKYAKGLGFRAPSSVRYVVKPDYERFVAKVGVADDLVAETYGARIASHGSVVFRVFVDERMAAESPVMRVSQEPWRFDVPLPSGSRHITLACLDAGSLSLLDLGNWVDAGFVLKNGAPAKTPVRATDNANTLDPDYKHASQEAYEKWRDLKYGIRIHWGVYSKLGVEASWPILKMSNKERASYQELYKTFNPADFDADQWMRWFERCGMKMFAFTTRHCDSFSMWDTKTRVKRRVNYGAPGGPRPEDCDLAYSIMESPLKRDIVKELCDAAHKHNMGIDLYFSHWDWYDYDFRSCENFPFVAPGDKMTGTQDDPEGYARMIKRHRDSILELLSNYGKIDMMCLDVALPDFCWPDVKETIMKARQLQPDVLFRNRGIGAYGDYHTPENWIPDSPRSRESSSPWMVIYTMAPIFAYQPDGSKYKPAEWVLSSLIDIVAKGGNFQISIGPDDKGNFHPTAVQRLE